MHLRTYVKIAVLSTLSVCCIVFSASAQWPTFDCSAVQNQIKEQLQIVQNTKTKIESCKQVTKAKTLLGDVQKAASGFAADKIAAAKALADKVKKEAEKVKKVKENIEKAKQEYEKRKAQYDEYKSKLQEAQKMVNEAKEAASGATSFVQGAVNDAKGMTTGALDKVKDTASSTVNKAKSTASITLDNGAVPSVLKDVPVTIPTSGVKASGNTVTTPAKATVTISNSTTPKALASETLSVTPQSVSTPITSVPTTNAPSAQSPTRSKFLTDTGSVKSLTIENSDLQIPEDEIFGEESPESVPEESEPKNQEDILETVKDKAKADGSMPAADNLQGVLRKAIKEKDEEIIDAISALDTADLVNSDSKIYDSQPATIGRKAFSTGNETSAVKQAPVTQGSDVQLSPEAINKTEPKGTNLEPAALGKSSFFMDSEKKTENHSVKISYNQTLHFGKASRDCEYSNTLEYKDDSGSMTVIILPETLAKECCLKADQVSNLNVIRDCLADKETGLLQQMYPPKFSDDEKNSNTDETLVQEAKSTYNKIMGEQKTNTLAEAMADSNIAKNYTKDRFTPFLEKLKKMHEDNQKKVASSSNGTSGISIKDELSLVQLSNREMIYLLNLIRRSYTSGLVSNSLGGLKNVTAGALDEDRDIGVDVPNDYSATIVRNEKDYPIIPENLAKKCSLKITDKPEESVAAVKDCFMNIVKDQQTEDAEAVKISQAFIENIQYQDTLDALSKALYHKYLSVVQDKREEEIKDKITGNQPDEKEADIILLETEKEMTVLINEILEIYAGQIAYDTLKKASELMPPPEITTTAKKG